MINKKITYNNILEKLALGGSYPIHIYYVGNDNDW
jgi:hypothetical protein